MLANLIPLWSRDGYTLYKAPTHLLDHETKEPLFGWGNGYVSVSKDHPYFEKHYDDLPSIDVHGGITYTDYYGANKEEWLIGFDCHHGMDTIDRCSESYVEDEVFKLYNVLKEIGNV